VDPGPQFSVGTSGCQMNCVACGLICPTVAIRPISLDEKLGRHGYAPAGPVRLGTAFVDRGRCLPWAMDKPCIVCQEVCPVAPRRFCPGVLRSHKRRRPLCDSSRGSQPRGDRGSSARAQPILDGRLPSSTVGCPGREFSESSQTLPRCWNWNPAGHSRPRRLLERGWRSMSVSSSLTWTLSDVSAAACVNMSVP